MSVCSAHMINSLSRVKPKKRNIDRVSVHACRAMRPQDSCRRASGAARPTSHTVLVDSPIQLQGKILLTTPFIHLLAPGSG